MFGIESLLTEVLGENQLLVMLAGFFLLIVLNLLTKLYIEYKKDDLNWNDLPEFIHPIVMYSMFLIGLELLTMTGKDIPVVYEIFQGLQVIGYVAVMAKYFKKFYENLKEAGLPTDEYLDAPFEQRLGNAPEETRKDIHRIIEEYFKNKEAK